jgi:uncharacterized protein
MTIPLYCRRRYRIICSLALLEEYDCVLAYPEVTHLIFPELLRAFRSHLIYDIEIIDPIPIIRICRDPDDDKVIATAIAGKVDYLVTETTICSLQRLQNYCAVQA